MHVQHVKKSSRRRRGWLALAVLALLAVLLIRGEQLLTRAVLAQAEAKAAALASGVLHQAAVDVLGDGTDYADLMTVLQDSNGHVRLLEANALQLNRLSTAVSLLAQQRLAEMDGQQLEVPLGAALGLTLLAQAGPTVHITLQPRGTVSAALESTFASAGVNQTRHTLLLRLSCTVRLALPNAAAAVTADTTLTAAECIIVGEVPQTLLQNGNLNLAP